MRFGYNYLIFLCSALETDTLGSVDITSNEDLPTKKNKKRGQSKRIASSSRDRENERVVVTCEYI